VRLIFISQCFSSHETDSRSGLIKTQYGQNIGAGYDNTVQGVASFITDGLYNGEVNNYMYYGGEPDTSTLSKRGHFS
jgi:hypothetical protein